MTNHRSRRVVITGASADIGQTLAHAYAAPGVTLGLVARDVVRLEACAGQCRQTDATVITAQLDVHDVEAATVWLTAFDDTHLLDLLTTNTGAANTLSPANDWEGLARTHEVFDTNFYGAFHTLLPVLAHLRARKRDHMAMISPLVAIHDVTTSPTYYASKSAIEAYGKPVQPSLAAGGVLLLLVLPDFVGAAMSDVFPGDKPFLWSTDKAARRIHARLDVGRAEIAFPALLALGMRLLPLLSPRLGDHILDRPSYLSRVEQ